MLGHSKDVPHSSMDNGDSRHDQDIELEGNGALDIHEDAFVIAYLQIGEVPIGLTPKEQTML
jgi:hypothetical protein